MAQDPEKLAQLNALATGGKQGLADYQAAAANAQAAQSQALSAASSYGTPDYHVSSGLQSALAATAQHASEPGVQAALSASAAAPGLAAMDRAAADTYFTRTNDSIQSKLAAAKAKIDAEGKRLDLETKQDQAERQNKLAALQLEREQSGAESQFNMDTIAQKEKAFEIARAMDPERITGQAMQNQAATVAEKEHNADGWAAGLGQSFLGAAQSALAGAKEKAEAKKAELEGAKNPHADDSTAVAAPQIQPFQGKADTYELGFLAPLAGGGTPGPAQESPVQDPSLVFKKAAEQQAWDAQHQLDLAKAQSEIDSLTAAGDATGRLNEQTNQSRETWRQQAEMARMDLPRFQFDEAVARGMDPDVAAGKYLSKEDDYILGEQEKQYRRENFGDTIEQREATREQQAAKREQHAQAEAAAEATGWTAPDLVKISDQTNLSIGDVAARVTSDAWKDVDNIVKNAGKKLDEKDAAALGDTSLTGSQFNEDTFKAWLMANDKLDQQTKLIAFNRYRSLFSLTPNEDNVGAG